MFSVTFEIVTPESAEYGEADSRGFVLESCTLREAIEALGGYACEADSAPISLANPPRWFTNYDYGEDYSSGAHEARSLHLPRNISSHSAMRVARLLGVS